MQMAANARKTLKQRTAHLDRVTWDFPRKRNITTDVTAASEQRAYGHSCRLEWTARAASSAPQYDQILDRSHSPDRIGTVKPWRNCRLSGKPGGNLGSRCDFHPLAADFFDSIGHKLCNRAHDGGTVASCFIRARRPDRRRRRTGCGRAPGHRQGALAASRRLRRCARTSPPARLG